MGWHTTALWTIWGQVSDWVWWFKRSSALQHGKRGERSRRAEHPRTPQGSLSMARHGWSWEMPCQEYFTLMYWTWHQAEQQVYLRVTTMAWLHIDVKEGPFGTCAGRTVRACTCLRIRGHALCYITMTLVKALLLLCDSKYILACRYMMISLNFCSIYSQN